MLFHESKRAQLDYAAAKKAGATVKDPTGQASTTVPGRKLMALGEILGAEKAIAELEAKSTAFETQGRKFLPGFERYDPEVHLRQLDEKYPNAHKFVDEWEPQADAA